MQMGSNHARCARAMPANVPGSGLARGPMASAWPRSLLVLALAAAVVLVGWVAPPPAHAAPDFKEPWPCGEVWYSHTYDSFTTSEGVVIDHGEAIDFNRTWTSDDNEGDLVLASAAGTATVKEDPPGYGHYVEIDHGDGWTTLYAHLREAPTLVDREPSTPGVQVHQGDVIGRVGKSGTTYSSITADNRFAHLHYEQRQSGADVPITFDGQAPQVGRTHTSADPRVESTNCLSSPDLSTAIITDSSGSMTSNDPQNRRSDAGRAYLSVSGQDEQVGVVDFASNATILSEAVAVGPNRQTLTTLIDGIGASGGTNLGRGLQAGCDLLGRAVGQERIAIFLTDGRGSYGGQSSCFADQGWKVFTIGLGSGVDDTLLQGIADDTGGDYLALADVTDLVCEVQQIRAVALGEERRSCEPTGTVLQGQRIDLQPTILGPDLQQATFSNTWGPTATLQPATSGDVLQPASFASLSSSPDLRMTLTSPSGREIDRDTVADDVIVEVGGASELITILAPEAGEWGVSVLGVTTPEAGTPFTFNSFEIEGEGTDEGEEAEDDEADDDKGDDDPAPDGDPGRPVRRSPPRSTPEPDTDDTAVLPDVEDACPDFTDVADSSTHHAHICALASDAMMRGYPSGEFRPGTAITRGQVASVLARVIGLEPLDREVATYDDIASSVHRGNIEALHERELIQGYGDGSFGADDPVRRDQVASIIAAWLGLGPMSGNRFDDVTAENAHAPQIYALVDRGIARGTTQRTYEPDSHVRRDQFASLVDRAR